MIRTVIKLQEAICIKNEKELVCVGVKYSLEATPIPKHKSAKAVDPNNSKLDRGMFPALMTFGSIATSILI